MRNNGAGKPDEMQMLLLRAALLSGAPARAAWNRWASSIDFDKIDHASYKLLPLIARNPALEGLEGPLYEKCKGIYRRTWVLNRLNWGKLLPVFSDLRRAGVDKIVLLKGMAMILSFYRDFGLRVIGDVDLFIPKAALKLAASQLRTSGWERFSATRFDLENEEHLKRWHALHFTRADGLNLDVHWSLLQENSPALDEAVWQGAVQLDGGLFRPHTTDLLLQTCVHGMKHSPVPLIRWIADAMTILKMEPTIEWDRLIHLATRARVCMPLHDALQYLAEHFNAPIPDAALRHLRTRSSLRLERLEYQFHLRGYSELAHWCRYCLNRGQLTRTRQWLHLLPYLQVAARLKSPWQMPFFAVYWVLKRAYRLFC